MRSANVSSDFTYSARFSGRFFVFASRYGMSSLCMRHFWWNAGDASESATVPCVPLMATENTA